MRRLLKRNDITSSSSDAQMAPGHDQHRRTQKKKEPTQIVVSYNERKQQKTVSVAVPDDAVDKVMQDVSCMCSSTTSGNSKSNSFFKCGSSLKLGSTTKSVNSTKIVENNNNSTSEKKDTMVEQNGNIENNSKTRRILNFRQKIPEVAHV